MSFSKFISARVLPNALALLTLTLSLSTFAGDRYKVSNDGQEITDTKTNLIWRRCMEGQTFDGKTCKSKATKFSFANARKHVSELGVVWRIPTRDELTDLLELSKKKKPLLDEIAFPSASSGLVWAMRPEMSDNLNAWIVNVGNGKVYGNPGSKKPYLRLVRSAV